jgi:hypothetical protein
LKIDLLSTSWQQRKHSEVDGIGVVIPVGLELKTKDVGRFDQHSPPCEIEFDSNKQVYSDDDDPSRMMI